MSKPLLRTALASAALALALCGRSSLAAQSSDFQILHFEPITLTSQSASSGTDKASQSVTARRAKHVSFSAYGRGFEIDLQPNPSLNEIVASGSTAVAYRGSITGASGSWVRITQTASATYGAVWDGSDLYVIEPAAEARQFAAASLDAKSAQTVIYRLSDTLIQLPSGFCDSLDGSQATNGAQTYQAIADELQSRKTIQAAGATKRIQIGALMDASFRARYNSDAEATDAVVVRLNNVDGIFSAQLGVEIQTPSMTIYTSSTDPFSSTTQPSNLLSELSHTRQTNSSLSALGLTHLFTGRDLDGDTVGIAYTSSICKSYGASLTESRGRGVFLESLISAHEIGHNFGAPHDGEGACASADAGYLMSPRVSGSDQFSQCSITQIRAVMQGASCITSLAPADASIQSTLSPVATTVGSLASSTFSIANSGGMSAANVQVELSVPTTLSIEAASINGVSCTSGAGTVECNAGTLAASANATITFDVRGTTVGQYTIGVHVISDNDADLSNNASSLAVTIADPPAPSPPVSTPTTPTAPATSADSGGGGGGGGGGAGPFLLLALGAFALQRRR